jgi:hypothetical protein
MRDSTTKMDSVNLERLRRALSEADWLRAAFASRMVTPN